MKKLLLSIVTACFYAALTGCTAEMLPTPEEDGRLCTFVLNTGSSVSVDTRVGTNPTALSEVWVVQLKKDGTTALSAPQHLTPDADNKIRAKLEKVDSKVYFFANTGDYALFDPEAALSTFTAASVEAIGMTYDGDWNEKTYIPMYGTWEGTPQVPLIGASPADKVELTSAFSRITVVLKGGTESMKNNFYPVSIQVKNVPNVLRMAPTTASGVYPAPSGTFINYPAVAKTGAESLGAYGLTYQFYMPENRRGTGAERYETEKNGTLLANAANYATYFELKGTIGYMSSTKMSYRFFLGENSVNDYNIKRNYAYTVTITLAGTNLVDSRVTVEGASLSIVSDTGVSWGGGSDLTASIPENDTRY